MSKDNSAAVNDADRPWADLPWAVMPNFPGQAVDTTSRIWSTWHEQTGRFQTEVLQFFAGRANHHIEMFKQVCACKNPYEILSLQAAFAQKTLSDYLEESRKLIDLYASGLQSGSDKPPAAKP